MKRFLYIVICVVLTACTEDGWNGMTPEQHELIGTAVDFNASRIDEFTHQTRSIYDDTGVFNERDLMRIYRQYQNDDGTWGTDAYRTYYFYPKYANGTTVALGTDWRVWPDRKGKNEDGTVIDPQKASDSITWENGKTVRFRSWTRSNYAYAITNCYKEAGANGATNYYPDFCISDWVTVSGPTKQIPLTMRHICSRIAISYRNNGSQFHRVEMATSLEDYKRPDNADFNDNDNDDDEAGKTDAQAQAELESVMAAYNRMCMPAGVDINNSALYAMKKDYWAGIANDAEGQKKLRFLEDEVASNFYFYGASDSVYIRKNVQRPVFNLINQSCYLLTIPYDMSNTSTQGDIITLPACTRFRVYLRDVNQGDSAHPGGYEANYHIFSLADIKKADGITPAFPNGLDMKPGYSYKFYVGYRYDQLTITANDHFSWDEQDEEEDYLQDAAVEMPTTSTAEYSWWKNALKEYIPKDGSVYNPEFHITSEKEFIEFIHLVNGTAASRMDEGLHRAYRAKKENPEHADNAYDRYNWWYTDVSANKRDTTWVTSAEATAMGFLLYEGYHAANANQPAFSQEEYITKAYPFYDETRSRHYTVYLDCDLDLADWELTSIGNAETTPFMGYFDGYCKGENDVAPRIHVIRNVNIQDEYLFKYIKSAAIRNLKIESTHKTSLVKEGSKTCYIVGVDMRAHCTRNAIAEKLTQNEYGNPCYVVGCIHVGDAGGALVGESNNLRMYGCMQAAEGIPTNTGALLGGYTSGSSSSFFAPQISFNFNDINAKLQGKPSWGRFMCNYYDTDLSAGTNAVGAVSDRYSPLEYIRGRVSTILKAKNDNLLSGDANFNALTSVSQRLAFYGLAPWKAMNYGIWRYNNDTGNAEHKCNAHYENNSTGYVHRYPELMSGVPASGQYANPLDQEN